MDMRLSAQADEARRSIANEARINVFSNASLQQYDFLHCAFEEETCLTIDVPHPPPKKKLKDRDTPSNKDDLGGTLPEGQPTLPEEQQTAGGVLPVLHSKWNQMFDRLVAFKDRHGHCLVPNRFHEDPALGAWVSTQRRQHKFYLGGQESTPMTPERIALLEGIGFVWSTTDPRHVPWETRFQQLRAYKEQYGNCLVPVGYAENQKLGNWVSTQRQEHKLLREGRPSRLTEERIQQLNSIGFLWEAQRGGPKKKRLDSDSATGSAKSCEQDSCADEDRFVINRDNSVTHLASAPDETAGTLDATATVYSPLQGTAGILTSHGIQSALIALNAQVAPEHHTAARIDSTASLAAVAADSASMQNLFPSSSLEMAYRQALLQSRLLNSLEKTHNNPLLGTDGAQAASYEVLQLQYRQGSAPAFSMTKPEANMTKKRKKLDIASMSFYGPSPSSQPVRVMQKEGHDAGRRPVSNIVLVSNPQETRGTEILLPNVSTFSRPLPEQKLGTPTGAQHWVKIPENRPMRMATDTIPVKKKRNSTDRLGSLPSSPPNTSTTKQIAKSTKPQQPRQNGSQFDSADPQRDTPYQDDDVAIFREKLVLDTASKDFISQDNAVEIKEASLDSAAVNSGLSIGSLMEERGTAHSVTKSKESEEQVNIHVGSNFDDSSNNVFDE